MTTKKLRAIELGRKQTMTPRQISDRLALNNSARVRRWLEEAGIPVVTREPYWSNHKNRGRTYPR